MTKPSELLKSGKLNIGAFDSKTRWIRLSFIRHGPSPNFYAIKVENFDQALALIESLEAELGMLKMGFVPEGSVDIKVLQACLEKYKEALKLVWQAYNCSFTRLHKMGAPIPTDPIYEKLKQILGSDFEEIEK